MNQEAGRSLSSVNSSTPLISILIATRNRQTYAAQSIIDILSWATPKLELIVEDNSDQDTLRYFLGPILKNPILNFHYNRNVISSIANFNATLRKARGNYVCLIGDDDGINSKIIEIVKWAHTHDIDCVIGSVKHEYTWPTDKQDTRAHDGLLTFPNFTASAQFLDVSRSIIKLTQQGGTRYLDLNFPRLYHGIVRRSLLENQKLKTGYYLGGLSPDIYAAISLAASAHRIVKIDYPLTIPGVCPASTTATEGKNRTSSTNIYDAPHFRGRTDYIVNAMVPPFYCADTMWAESTIAAIKDISRSELLKSFNINSLCASIIDSNPKLFWKVIRWRLKECKISGINRIGFMFDLVFQYVKGPFISIILRIYKKLIGRYLGSKMHVQQQLFNIGAARIFIEEVLAARGLDPLHALHALQASFDSQELR